MVARRQSYAALMAPLMAVLAVILLGLAPANAASVRGDAAISAASAPVLAHAPAAQASAAHFSVIHVPVVHDRAVHLSDKVMSCAKLEALPPAPRQCQHAVGASVALRRPRSDTDGIAILALAHLLSPRAGSYDVERPPITGARLPPSQGGPRAPFWAVFAMVSRLRN